MSQNTLIGTLLATLLGSVLGSALEPGQAQARSALPDPAALFTQADSNHDGQVSRAEYLAARGARFDLLDRNPDGVLSEADFPRLAKASGNGARAVRDLLKQADTDHDGRVSRAEFETAGTPVFDLLDTDHNGLIGQAELQQAGARLAALRKSRE